MSSLGVNAFLNFEIKGRMETSLLLLSGCERESQKISIGKNNILFLSIAIEAEPFSNPAAAKEIKFKVLYIASNKKKKKDLMSINLVLIQLFNL